MNIINDKSSVKYQITERQQAMKDMGERSGSIISDLHQNYTIHHRKHTITVKYYKTAVEETFE